MKKVLTLILDGFGYREEEFGNAIWAAKPNNFIDAFRKYPHSLLDASGTPIGLDANQFGNSEIGHMTIGAGRVIPGPKQNVDTFLANKNNDSLNELVKNLKEKRGKIHLMGLLSDGKVHSDIEHFKIIYQKLVSNGLNDIYFHLISDGRDTDPTSFMTYYNEIKELTGNFEIGKVATICGRYYAMDRDQNYDRTLEYYNILLNRRNKEVDSVEEAIKSSYENNITDEFIKPFLVDKDGLISNNDSIIWMNYRTDRAKQIISAFTVKDFNRFNRYNFVDLDVYTFVEIDKKIPTNVLITNQHVENPLGVYLSNLGLTQARVAETEKYAHVTYFFDGEFSGNLEGASYHLIPSPKVATYDLQPEMSIVKVTKKVIECMENDIDFILCNFANPDMVGHTGNYDATVKAVMAVDICLGKLIEKAEENFYKVIILADHGNADTMYDKEGNVITTHTMEKVPFIIMDNKIKLKERGTLANVAPTILEYMDIAVPKEMKDTKSLIE